MVEDEVPIAGAVSLGLRQAGYTDVASDGLDGLAQARGPLRANLAGCYAVQNGQIGCLRDVGSPTPIQLLTTRDLIGDRVRGLETGADDYLPKPFDFCGLLACTHSLLAQSAQVSCVSPKSIKWVSLPKTRQSNRAYFLTGRFLPSGRLYSAALRAAGGRRRSGRTLPPGAGSPPRRPHQVFS